MLPSLQTLLVVWGAFCVSMWVVLGRGAINLPLLLHAASLTVTLLASYLLACHYPRLAGVLLLSGTMGSVVLTATAGGSPDALLLLTPIIVAAGGLLTPRASLLWAGMAAALALWLQPPGEKAGSYAILFAVTGVSTWAAFQPQYSLLFLAWGRGAAAAKLTEQLRDERGELNRTIKALDLSYQLLEKTNRELALAQREADALRDLRNRFATNLSHELRTPLNIVLGFANLIYRNPHLYGFEQWEDVLLRDLAQIQRNARYLSQLVDDVLDLARIDALAMPLRRELTAARQVVEEAVEAVSTLAASKALVLVVDCDPALPELFVDALRIRQVLFNLLSNAVRFTEHGSIRVEVRGSDSEVCFVVRDSGRGIPPDELSTIFDEFHQIGRPKTEPDAGKGLGLAIARQFVQLHGGRIWAESVIGSGSVFTFTIPFAGARASRLRISSPLPIPRRRKAPTVLVLSRDDSAALYLGRRLEGYDFVPCLAPDTMGAALEEVHPAAVLLDATTGIGVEEVRAALDGRWSDLPLLSCPLPNMGWVSGDGDFRLVLTKPVSAEKLLSALAEVLPDDGPDLSVLVVDDDRGFVQLVARTLQASGRGYRWDTAYSGEEALRKARRTPPACVLLDLMLPDMSGFDTLAAIRAQPGLAATPAIAVTAATPGEDQLASEGASFGLERGGPFRPGELVALLSSVLGLVSGEPPDAGSAATP